MFLLLRVLSLVLIIVGVLGCGTDDDSSGEVPIVTIDLIEQKGEEVWLRLNLNPTPTTELAVLMESVTPNQFPVERDAGYAWVLVPKFANSYDFKLSVDDAVSWKVKLLSLAGVNLNTYPIEGSEIPTGFAFKQYKVGDRSSVTTEPTPPAKLLFEWLSLSQRIPANATLPFIFNKAPEDIVASHGKIATEGSSVTLEGPFPLGNITLQLTWDQGRGRDTWYNVITESDFEHPKIVGADIIFKDGWVWPFVLKDGWVWPFQGGGGFGPDVSEIRIHFNEKIWFHEQVTGMPDIQTEDGTKLGWRAEKVLLKANSIRISLLDGQPLEPQTTYTIAGTVTDLVNETEIDLTFTTTPRWVWGN